MNPHVRRLVHPETGEASSDLTHIRARHITPVDLNALLCKNARLLARFHLELGDAVAAKRYRQVSKIRSLESQVLTEG